MKNILPALFAAGMFATSAVGGSTDEPLTFESNLAPGAMICDYADSVRDFMDTGKVPIDCGAYLAPDWMVMQVTVTIIGEHSMDGELYPIAMVEFHDLVPWGNQIQFVYWAGDLPEIGVRI